MMELPTGSFRRGVTADSDGPRQNTSRLSVETGDFEREKEATRDYFRTLLDGENSGLFYVILASIIVGTVTTIVETMPELKDYHFLFQMMDGIIALCFSVEICMRFYVSSSWEFFTNWFNIIDILAVLPNYLELLLMIWHLEVHNIHQAAGSFRALRMTRIIRLVRLARLARVVRLVKEWNALSQMELLLKVLVEEGHSGMTLLMLLSLTSLFVACVMYVVDEPCQGLDARSEDIQDRFQFPSLPAAWCWSVVTLTTVGYNGLPATMLGKFVAACTCICGVLILAHGAAQFSMRCNQRWLRLQATQKMKQQYENDAGMLKELGMLDEGLQRFEASLAELLEEVSIAALSGDGRSGDLKPFTKSLESRAQTLNSGICAFLHEALGPAMLQPKGQDEDDESGVGTLEHPKWEEPVTHVPTSLQVLHQIMGAEDSMALVEVIPEEQPEQPEPEEQPGYASQFSIGLGPAMDEA